MRSQKKSHTTIKGTLAFLSVAFMTASLGAQSYHVQVFVTSKPERAEQIVRQVNAHGFGPAELRPAEDGSVIRVLTAPFETRAAANFAQPRLRGIGFHDVFTVAEGEEEKASAEVKSPFGDVPSVVTTSEYRSLPLHFRPEVPRAEPRANRITPELAELSDDEASEAQLLAKADGWWLRRHAGQAVASYRAFIERFPGSPDRLHAEVKLAYWLLEAGERDAAREQFEKVRKHHPETEQAGEATLRLGYLYLTDRHRDADALAAFLEVASGRVPANDDVRAEAMLRSAALFHRAGDRATAIAAYQRIADVASTNELRAFSEMQVAGLHLELAWGGESTFEHARALCDQVLKKYPDVSAATRATAALMAMETHAYEGDYARVLQRSDAFLAEFRGIPEASLGYYWIARAMLETGDHEGAEQAATALLSDELPTTARFRNLDVEGAVERVRATAAERSRGSRGNR